MGKNLHFCCIIAASMALAGEARADGPAAQTTQPATQPAPQTSTIKRGSLSLVIDGQAAFDPVDPYEVRLRLKVYQGELSITSIAPNGKSVKKGDVILDLGAAAMNRAVAAAENEALAAHAALVRTQADTKIAEQADALALKQQDESLKEAEQDVQWFEAVDGPQMLKQADLAVQQAKDLVSDEQDELDQLRKMYKSEELTSATADIVVKRAVRQLDMSQIGYKMAKERAEKTRMYNFPIVKRKVDEGLQSAHQSFDLFKTSYEQTKVLRQTNLAAVTAAADAANLKLEEIKADAAKLTVRSPIDGIVCYGQVVNGALSGGDARALRPDEHLAAGAIIMTVYRPGRMRLVIDLPENKFFAIKPGQKVSVSPVAFPELKYEGQCDAVPHTVVGAGGYVLTISSGDIDSRVVPGMKADVHMDVPLVDNVLLAPVGAVKESAVTLKTGADTTESRHVMTGRSDGKMIEILSGLKEGDEVLTQAK